MIVLLNVKTGNNNKSFNISTEIKESLVGKKCKSISSIIDFPKMRSSNFVVLLYNGYDCDVCVESGVSVVKSIDAKYEEQKAYVISTMANPSVIQEKYRYTEYIYSDDSDLIRKELKFVPTPILLHIDSSFKIIDVLIPDANNKQEQHSFVQDFIEY